MSKKIVQQRVYESLSMPFKFVAAIWLIHFAQSILHLNLGSWGIYPRETFGLPGIITAPLIHADFSHLLSNTPPLFILSAMVLFFYRSVAISSISLIYLLTGAAVWVFGRPVFHIGASGVIYGLAAFVVFSGIFRRNLKSIALALIVGFYYGSMIYGVLPGQEGVSWESHLLGAMVGIFASFVFKNSIERDEHRQIPSWENDPTYNQEQFFLNRDAFLKTKSEREKETRDNGWWR